MGRQFTAPNAIEEPQSYLVSVGDMLSGLLFVFIITLVIFSLRLKDTQRDLAEELTRAQAENSRLVALQEEMEKRLQRLEAEKARLEKIMALLTGGRAVRELLLNDIQSALSQEGFQVRVDLEHGILSLPEEILFASGSASLRPDGRQMLNRLAEILESVLPRYSFGAEISFGAANVHRATIEAILIEGHTDNVPLAAGKNFEDNWDLSTARAIQTYKTLTGEHARLEEFQNEYSMPLFSVSGYADKRPVADNMDDIGRQQNRRIDLRFIMSSPRATPEAVEAVEKEFGLAP